MVTFLDEGFQSLRDLPQIGWTNRPNQRRKRSEKVWEWLTFFELGKCLPPMSNDQRDLIALVVESKITIFSTGPWRWEALHMLAFFLRDMKYTQAHWACSYYSEWAGTVASSRCIFTSSRIKPVAQLPTNPQCAFIHCPSSVPAIICHMWGKP